MSSTRGALLPAALAIFAMGCGLIIGLHEPEGQQLPAQPPPGADPCAHTGPPGPPAHEDDGPSVAPFWLALRKSYIGQPQGDGGTLGIDLDGVCTCKQSPNTAYDGGSSCTPRGKSTVVCDDDGGIDNSVEQVFSSYTAIFDPNHFGERIDEGDKTVLIYIADYNGQPNDLSVTVGFAASNGLYTTDCDPTLVVNDNAPGVKSGNTFTASWRGCDQWHGVPDQFLGNPADPTKYAPKETGKGYVRDGVLVMSGDIGVPVFFSDQAATVEAPTLVATLEKVPTKKTTDPQRFRMPNAMLAGRLPFADMASVAFTTTYNGFYTCQNLTTFRTLMSTFCAGVDVTESKTLDFRGQPCTAMSFAFRFDADLADLDRADRTPGSSPPNPCLTMTVPSIDELCPQ
jgi:hypothetical protein